MIFALNDESLDCKDHVSDDKGREFMLSHYQRRQLWKDEVLGRFAWVLPACDSEDLDVFIAMVMRLAENDGFKISFPTLYGGDHICKNNMAEGLSGWDGWTCIGSDFTRPMDFVPEDGGEFLQLEDCGTWKKMRNDGPKWTGKEGEKPDCWPCWPCAKMRRIFSEDFESDGTFALGSSLYHPSQPS